MCRSRWGICWGLLGVVWVVILLMLGTAVAEGAPTVRMIYLIPSDREIQPGYTAAIASAIQDVQLWYRHEIGNQKTFQLQSPIVEVFPHDPPGFMVLNESGR